MVRFLFKLWPALLPVVLYYIWRAWLRRKHRHDAMTVLTPEGERLAGLEARWLIIALGVSLVIALGSVAVFGITAKSTIGGTYIPAHTENGKIIPAQLVPQRNEAK